MSSRKEYTMQTGQYHRQGDVLLMRVDSIPESAKKSKRKGDIVIEWGEVTGHAHRITSRDADVYTDGTAQFLRVLSEAGVDMTHEEHGTVTFPKGDYVRLVQVEHTPFGERRVAD